MQKTDKWELSLNLFKKMLVLLGTFHLPPGEAGLCTSPWMPSANNSVTAYISTHRSCAPQESTPALKLKPVLCYVPDLSDRRVSGCSVVPDV